MVAEDHPWDVQCETPNYCWVASLRVCLCYAYHMKIIMMSDSPLNYQYRNLAPDNSSIRTLAHVVAIETFIIMI